MRFDRFLTFSVILTLGFPADVALGYARYPTEFQTIRRPSDKRNYLLPPLVSFLLPGFDQYQEGQLGYGLGYSGLCAGGLTLSLATLSSENSRLRSLGLQYCAVAGGLSAYHSFKTAVGTRRTNGEFTFIEQEDSIFDLLAAPFEFSFIKRPTTFITLGLALGLMLLVRSPSRYTYRFTASDAAITSAISYNAGVWEEAMFRGYIYPALYQQIGSRLISNLIQSSLFAVAHFPTVSVPVFQGLFGFYLGEVTARNGWSIRESIFIHTWWDVIVLGVSLASDSDKDISIQFPSVVFQF